MNFRIDGKNNGTLLREIYKKTPAAETPMAFMASLSTIQGILMKVQESAGAIEPKRSSFVCPPLPAYHPPCPSCIESKYYCLMISGSTLCAYCVLKRVSCRRDGTESAERMVTEVESAQSTPCSVASPRDIGQVDAEVSASYRTPSSAKTTPSSKGESATFVCGPSTLLIVSTDLDVPTSVSAALKETPVKRPAATSSKDPLPVVKKPRLTDAVTSQQEQRSIKPTDLKKIRKLTRKSTNAVPNSKASSRPIIEGGAESLLLQPSANSGASSSGAQDVLAQAVRSASSEIITYTQEHPCQDVRLRLKILDLKTRLDALDGLTASTTGSAGKDKDVAEVTTVEEMVSEVQHEIVSYVTKNGCSDVRLKIKVVDLGTRLSISVGPPVPDTASK